MDKHFKSLYKTTDLKDEVRKKTFAFSSIWVCALIGVGISISLGAMTIGFPIIPVLAASAIVFLSMGVYIGYRKSLDSAKIKCIKNNRAICSFIDTENTAECFPHSISSEDNSHTGVKIPVASKSDSSYRQAKNCQPLYDTIINEEYVDVDTREVYHQHAKLTFNNPLCKRSSMALCS